MFPARRLSLVPALILALSTSPSGEAAAQLGGLTSVGYGTVGFVTGAALTAGAECTGGFVCIPAETVAASLSGGVLGLVLGHHLAKSAGNAVEAGRPAPRLGAVAVGATVGGGVLGVVAAGVLTSMSGDRYGQGTFLGSDGQTYLILGLAGAGLTVRYLVSRWGELSGGSVEVAPTVVGRDPGMRLSVRF